MQTNIFPIESGVPQESVLVQLLVIFTAGIPKIVKTTLASLKDDTAIFSSSDDPVIVCTIASINLQKNLSEF